MPDDPMARFDHASMQQELLHRAEAAARQAGHLAVDWFWIRRLILLQRAERLSSAAERTALAAERAH